MLSLLGCLIAIMNDYSCKVYVNLLIITSAGCLECNFIYYLIRAVTQIGAMGPIVFLNFVDNVDGISNVKYSDWFFVYLTHQGASSKQSLIFH